MASSPSAGLPTEPRCASHSCPVMMVPPMASVPAYSSQMTSGPSRSIHACFNHTGQGAAICHRTRMVDRSNRPGC
ncbi:Uncharacterised protein [Mycobacteroides abscessus subsp. abscessus]|nr:Uncharacterised protein [Mycobacteroides abscessus subsp. abscessus]